MMRDGAFLESSLCFGKAYTNAVEHLPWLVYHVEFCVICFKVKFLPFVQKNMRLSLYMLG